MIRIGRSVGFVNSSFFLDFDVVGLEVGGGDGIVWLRQIELD